MNYEECIELGLNGEAPLKIILCGSVVDNENHKVGVVSVVFATMDKMQAKDKIDHLISTRSDSNDYYMVYSVPLDMDLTKLEHFPSIAITKSDLT